jgi:hypothetical protein
MGRDARGRWVVSVPVKTGASRRRSRSFTSRTRADAWRAVAVQAVSSGYDLDSPGVMASLDVEAVECELAWVREELAAARSQLRALKRDL